MLSDDTGQSGFEASDFLGFGGNLGFKFLFLGEPCLTRTGKPNTTTNLEKRNEVIMKKAGLEYKGGLHILRRTFATNCYRKGGRTKQIAAYIGDLASTTEKYYIAARKKVCIDGANENVVFPPV